MHKQLLDIEDAPRPVVFHRALSMSEGYEADLQQPRRLRRA